MTVFPSPTGLRIYTSFEERFCGLLEANDLSYAVSRQLAKLAKGLLRGLKKSVSALQRLYFPEFLVQNVLTYLQGLIKKFESVNQDLIQQIRKSWDKRRRVFVICDDYFVFRNSERVYRSGKFRDPVVRTIRTGHNVVDTLISTNKLEICVDFALQPKDATVPKTQRAGKQVLRALSIVDRHGTPQARIRVLLDGGYTNNTVLPPLREQGRTYLGTMTCRKRCNVFGKIRRTDQLFSRSPPTFRTIHGKKYFYEHKTLNLTDWGRHQVFKVRRAGVKDWKFILTNDLKMTPTTFLRCQQERWWIEQSHRDLKQFCGLSQLFVRTKYSVEGRFALCYLIKNFLTLLLLEQGKDLRSWPFETLVEKEFGQVEQYLISLALNSGLVEKLEGY